MWAAIWDRAGLQNRPARFNPSAAREDLESAPRGGELVPKTRVTFGSEVRFLRSPQVRRGDEVHVGSAHRPATPASVRAPRVRLSPSPPSGQSRACGGEPTPGTARSSVEVAKTVRPPTATRCTRGFDSRPRLSFAPKVFQAARRLASSEERVRFPLGAQERTRGQSERGTGLPSRRGGFDSRRVLSLSFCREGWRPSRPHKPDPVGSIPTPATGSDLMALL